MNSSSIDEVDIIGTPTKALEQFFPPLYFMTDIWLLQFPGHTVRYMIHPKLRYLYVTLLARMYYYITLSCLQCALLSHILTSLWATALDYGSIMCSAYKGYLL